MPRDLLELKPAAAVLLGQQRRSNKAVTRNTVGTIRFALANHIFRRWRTIGQAYSTEYLRYGARAIGPVVTKLRAEG